MRHTTPHIYVVLFLLLLSLKGTHQTSSFTAGGGALHFYSGASLSLSFSPSSSSSFESEMFESNSKWNWNPLFPRDSKVLINKRLQKKKRKKRLSNTIVYNNIDRGFHNNNDDNNNRSMEENLGRPGVRSETEEPIERGP